MRQPVPYGTFQVPVQPREALAGRYPYRHHRGARGWRRPTAIHGAAGRDRPTSCGTLRMVRSVSIATRIRAAAQRALSKARRPVVHPVRYPIMALPSSPGALPAGGRI